MTLVCIENVSHDAQILVELYGSAKAHPSATAQDHSRNAGVAQVLEADDVTLLWRLQQSPY